MTTQQFLSASLSVALAATATAQLQFSGVSHTVIGVHATQGSTTQKTLPRGTKVGSGFQIRTVAGDSSASAAAAIVGGVARFRVAAAAGGNANGRGSSGVWANALGRDGFAKVRFHARSATPLSGTLVAKVTFESTGFTYTSLGLSEATIRVGNHPVVATDSAEVPWLTRQFATTLGPAGMDIEVGLSCLGSGETPITFGAEVELRFVPGHRITSYGTDEWAPLHASFPHPHTVQLDVWGFFPNAQTFVLAGFDRLNLDLGGAFGSRLLLNPVVIVPGPRTDPLGFAVMKYQMPNKHFKVLTQVFLYEPVLGAGLTTNALDMEIVKR